ncbi:23 kDa integral membrane protein [Echinococcus granulosus]|uniref:Tetraspanin n=1 Tax=Echinococcus granulosus TaxID=6210 RepID=A0A068WHP7_ECHGR|nr:23 kDa integral membrane protein [Echinococcus granulosus]CDS17980.1 tetraspanin [Echinococcus granulosus]
MALSCGGKCLKFLVFFFNAIVFIGGGIIAGYGIFLIVKATKAAGSFAVIVAILLVAEIVCGIVLLVYRHDFVKHVGKEMQREIKELTAHGRNASDPTLKAIYKLQEELKCCGGVGPEDWNNSYPASCCGSKETSCTQPYQQGCAVAMYEQIKDSSLAFGLIILVVCLIQIGAVICACCLAKKVHEHNMV